MQQCTVFIVLSVRLRCYDCACHSKLTQLGATHAGTVRVAGGRDSHVSQSRLLGARALQANAACSYSSYC